MRRTTKTVLSVSMDSELTGLSVLNTTRRHLVGWKNSIVMQDREVYYPQQFFIQTRVAKSLVAAFVLPFKAMTYSSRRSI